MTTDAERLRALETPPPDGQDQWTLQGRVITKVLNEGTPMARRLLALEEPGGRFLALHGKDGLDVAAFAGRWVEVRGAVWLQSFTATSIAEVPEG
jgi:hypothetical protein